MKREEVKRTAMNMAFRKIMPMMSLRNRIAFYYTVATAFLIALVFTIIYFMVDHVVYRQFDEELESEITEILRDAHVINHDFIGLSRLMNVDIDDKGDEDEEHEKNEQAEVDIEFIQIVNNKGQIIRKSLNLSRNILAFEPGHSETVYSNSRFRGAPVRQVQLPLVNRNGITEGYLLVAVPLKDAINVLLDLQKVLLLSFPLIILTLFILTRSIAGRSIRPIEKVIATAEKMTQANLDQRIAMPHHHDELYRLSATINDLLDRMHEAFQREKQFTADASHELKTPLAAVKGTLEVLVRKPREREHYETKVQFCLKELNRMASLIDQLLMLARYESSRMNPKIEEIDLSQHLDDVVERMRPLADEKEISFNVEKTGKGRAAADPAMLEMILENIISNAVKYSPAGSSITIAEKHQDHLIMCSITDQGIGIPEEQLHAVFERFYRVDESRSLSTGGFGLGLSIVKKLADLQKITVSVKSAKNKGTTFELTFPSA